MNNSYFFSYLQKVLSYKVLTARTFRNLLKYKASSKFSKFLTKVSAYAELCEFPCSTLYALEARGELL